MQRDEITLADLGRTFLRYRLTIAIVSVMTIAASAMVAFVMQPVYRASVLVMPVSASKPIGGLASLASNLGGLAGLGLGAADQHNVEAMALLQSRSFTQKFIAGRALLPHLFPERWDAHAKSWSVPEDDVPTLGKGFKKFDRDVRTVSEDKLSGLITISMDHPDRAVIAAWANGLVADVNEYMRHRARDEAGRSIEFLRNELKNTGSVEIATAISKLIEQQLNEIMLANVRQEYAFKIIDPAITPDKRSYVRPNRALIIAIGVIGGLLLGCFAALIRHAFSRSAT